MAHGEDETQPRGEPATSLSMLEVCRLLLVHVTEQQAGTTLPHMNYSFARSFSFGVQRGIDAMLRKHILTCDTSLRHARDPQQQRAAFTAPQLADRTLLESSRRDSLFVSFAVTRSSFPLPATCTAESLPALEHQPSPPFSISISPPTHLFATCPNSSLSRGPFQVSE